MTAPTPTPDPWAAKVLDQARAATPGEAIPEYGSPEFAALPETSPLRVASALAAAEAWRAYWSPEEHARRLEEELTARRAEASTDAQRLADAIAWAAGAPGRVEVLAARAQQSIRATQVRQPEAFAPPRTLVNTPDWPAVVAPPGAEVVEADQLRLIRQVTDTARELRAEHAAPVSAPGPPERRAHRRDQSVGVGR